MPIISDPGDVNLNADSGGSGKGRIVFSIGRNEIAGISANGTGTGLLGGSQPLSAVGAVGDGTTDDAAAINAAIVAANLIGAASGAIVQIDGAGKLYSVASTVTLRSFVQLCNLTIKAANGSNTDLVKSYQYDSLTGGGTSGGVQLCGFKNAVLDGNKANNPTGGSALKYYGSLPFVEDVIVRNTHGKAVMSEWSSSAVVTDGCEGRWVNVTVHDGDDDLISWAGPHDTKWVNVTAFKAGTGKKNVHIKAGAAVHVAIGCHTWGLGAAYAWYIESKSILKSCQGEGASTAQVFVGASDCQIDGDFFAGDGTVQPTTKGIVIGDGTHLSITGTMVNARVSNCEGGSIDFTNSGGSGHVAVAAYQDGANPAVVGTVPSNEQVAVRVAGARATDSINYHPSYGLQVRGAAASAILVVGASQVFQVNGSNKRTMLPNAGQFILYSDNYATEKGKWDGTTGFITCATGIQKGISAYNHGGTTTPNAVAGDWQNITVTAAGAWTMAAPTNPPDSTHTQDLTLEINNASGGVMGAITWNAIYKLIGGAFTNPANANKRFITFRWNGSAWVEISRAAADYT